MKLLYNNNFSNLIITQILKVYILFLGDEMIKVKEYNSEFEVFQQINMMNEEELVQYRIKNKEHNESIQKRTVRNFISGTIKKAHTSSFLK